MDKSVQVCISCNTSLAIGLKLHFCPYCGTAQLEKKLLEQKTTQHFDPDNPSHKPWRDRCRLPKRNYKNVSAKKPVPWCPPMRQLRIRPVKSKPDKQVSEEQAPGAAEEDRPKETFEEEQKCAEYGEAVESSPEVDGATENEVEPPPEAYLGCKTLLLVCVALCTPANHGCTCVFVAVYTESTCPIAIYDAEHWLAIGGMAVNISLVQQTLGQANHGYWLRVGVMFDDDVGGEDRSPVSPPRGTAMGTEVPEASTYEAVSNNDDRGEYNADLNATPDSELQQAGEDEGQQYIIAVLSSDTAKFMVPRVEDWVDLCAVSCRRIVFILLCCAYDTKSSANASHIIMLTATLSCGRID